MREYFERLYKKDKENFYDLVKKNLKNKKRMFIVTANPETFTYGMKDEDINKMLIDDNVTLVPDGIAIVKCSKKLGMGVKERITGIDLSEELLKICNDNKYNLALLGASKEVIEKLVEIINEKYPKINIILYEDGYTKTKDKFFEKLSKLDVDVCLVALGIPNQEKLIYKHLSKFKKGIFIGVGGSFDVMSTIKKRAPKIFIKLNLEWLYRIACEPKRLKRFYNNNVKFILNIKKYAK